LKHLRHQGKHGKKFVRPYRKLFLFKTNAFEILSSVASKAKSFFIYKIDEDRNLKHF
jgi:hypothetical protein